MTYRVLYTSMVRDAISEQIAYLKQQQASGDTIASWFAGLFDLVDGLSVHPLRYPVVEPYSAVSRMEVRRLTYGVYLVYYTVREDDKVVEVLAFRHGHRRDNPQPE